MTCFLVDDKLLSNGKILDAFDRADPHAATLAGLWTCVGLTCSGVNSEGVVAGAVVSATARSLMVPRDVLDIVVKALVGARLWHDHKTVRRCTSCQEHLAAFELTLGAGMYLFHDWNDQQFSALEAKDPIAKANRARSKQLSRMPWVTKPVRERDGDVCRYCACEVNFGARKGPQRGTYDHKDPSGPNTIDNIVVACGRCNGEKKNRTPDEWVSADGRPLLPPPNRGAS